MKKSMIIFWCWLISFLPYRRVKINSVIGSKLEFPLDPIDLKVVKDQGIPFSKKRDRESKGGKMTKGPFIELVKKYRPKHPGYGEVGYETKTKIQKGGKNKFPKQKQKRRR